MVLEKCNGITCTGLYMCFGKVCASRAWSANVVVALTIIFVAAVFHSNVTRPFYLT
jgi:type IV secretory pathway VirB2 component (pilin)